MARQHEGLSNDRLGRQLRRRADPWDRMKILIFLGLIIVVSVGSEVNPPFVTLGEAIADFLETGFGLAMGLAVTFEVVRQLHYALSERIEGYHRFWSDRVFGGVERVVTSRFRPWTRFRVSRFVRWGVYVAIYAFIADSLRPDISGPVDAVRQFPRILLDILPLAFQLVFYMAIVVGQFVAIFWFLSRGGVDVLLPEEIRTRFSDVWGQDHVLTHVKENIAFLENPDEIEAKGGYIPGGILLWGPPGTGKTMMAEAIAGQTGKPFVFVDPGAFINMFMGVGILKVKSLYRKLRKLSLRHGGVIVFFDEADSLGSRGGVVTTATERPFTSGCNGMTHLSPASHAVLSEVWQSEAPEPRRRFVDRIFVGAGMGGGGGMGTIQALLTEMNGLTKPRGIWNRLRKVLGFRPKPPPKYRILHIMATNQPDALDPAMLRPGRIDRIYKVGYPSREGRMATIRGYLNKVPHALSEAQVDRLALATPYYSGAKIKDMVNEGLILALRNEREAIEWQDIWRAKTLKELGPPEDVEYIERERHAVAVHEACHAVVAHVLGAHRLIDIVTIEKHPEFLGMVKNLAFEDRYTQWRSEFEVDIMVSLASRAGERLFFDGDNSSGVSGDLSNASRLAAMMESVWGMGEGLLSYYNNRVNAAGTTDHPVSVALAERPDQIQRILDDLYERTHELLVEYQEKVLELAAVLEERKTISGDDVAEVMGSAPGERTLRSGKGWQRIERSITERAKLPAPVMQEPTGDSASEPAD